MHTILARGAAAAFAVSLAAAPAPGRMTLREVGDGVARIYGLSQARAQYSCVDRARQAYRSGERRQRGEGRAEGLVAAGGDGDERTDGNVHVSIRPTFDGADNFCTPGGSNYFPNRTACRELQGGDAGWGPLRVGIHGVGSGGDRIAAGRSLSGRLRPVR